MGLQCICTATAKEQAVALGERTTAPIRSASSSRTWVDLKKATQLRHGLRPGSSEWRDAVKVEEGLIDRIRHWVRPRRGDLTDS
jgi:hypothetical protein